MQAFETQFVPPELVAKELGVAAAVAFGVSLLHSTVGALPLKGAGPVVAKGLWLLGGAFVLARLTGGTLAHVVAMFGRNASRKRRLQRQLEAVQVRAWAAAAAAACVCACVWGGGVGWGRAGSLPSSMSKPCTAAAFMQPLIGWLCSTLCPAQLLAHGWA